MTHDHLILAAGLCALAGCASLGGVGGTSDLSCPAPPGVACRSMSDTYAASAGTVVVPSHGRGSGAADGATVQAGPRDAPVRTSTAVLGPTRTIAVGAPLRSAPRDLRLWIAPWEDTERDLHGDSVIYVRVDDGRWLIEHYQEALREQFAPLRPPVQAQATATPEPQTTFGPTAYPSLPAAAVRAAAGATVLGSPSGVTVSGSPTPPGSEQ